MKIKKRKITKIGTVKVRKIISIVNEYFDVNCLENNRRKTTVMPRQIAMYYARLYTILSCEEVGMFFNRDHSSVSYSIKSVKNYIDVDKNFRADIKKLDELMLQINFKSPLEFKLFETRELIFKAILKMKEDELNELKKLLIKEDESTNDNTTDNYLLHYE